MKIAAIDLGSNSIHMIIVEVNATGAFRVVDRETEMMRLGSGTLTTGLLPEVSMQRALSILKAFRRLAEIQGVEKILAVATSAVREARNGEDFLDRVGRKAGIYPLAIPGEEEARLIYLAALHSIHLGKQRALVADLGGGSLELAVGRGQEIEAALSEKLGVLRMAEKFVTSDPLSPHDEKRLVKHAEKTLEPALRRIRRKSLDLVVGTSGTILAVGRLAGEHETGQRPESLHHVTVSTEAIHAVRRRLCRLDMRARLKLPGLDRRRADVIVVGAIVLDTLLRSLEAPAIVLSEWALREGILLEYIRSHPKTLARAEAYPDVRRRSVLDLAERCQYDEPHGRHVARLSLALFDATRRWHGLADDKRSLLEYAALLHDVGHHISHTRHHKHTHYLIKNGRLNGFDPLEIDMIAAVARYHRRGAPKQKHPLIAALPREARGEVEALAAILRLADGLDRSHRQVVRDVHVSRGKGGLSVRCRARGNAELEMWGARKRVDLLSALLGTPVEVEVVPASPPHLRAVASPRAPRRSRRAPPGARRVAAKRARTGPRTAGRG